MLAELKNNKKLNDKMSYAKPSLKWIFKFGKGELDINGSTMDFLMYLSPHVDYDGRINISLEEAALVDLGFQKPTFQRILSECKYHKLIVKKGNHYHSNFHIQTNGSDRTRSYVKLLKAYSSPEIHNASLRQKRLFYYFLGVTSIGQWTKIHIENLYQNKIHKDGVGVNYFDTFKEISIALLQLVEDGLIEIKFPNSSRREILKSSKRTQILTKGNSPEENELVKAIFNKYFECDIYSKTKKKRTSLKQSKDRVIQVRIASRISNDLIKVSASEKEITDLLDKNYVPWEEMKPETIDYIIGYKNKLFRMAGETGLSIYRESIRAYINENAASLLFYDSKDKMANYFMDFYLLKEIRKILGNNAYHQKNMFGSNQSRWKRDWKMILCNKYWLNSNDIGNLIAFYMEHGSLNHKVLLDGELFKNQVDYSELFLNTFQWEDLRKTVEQEYQNKKNEYIKADTILRPIYFKEKDWRSFMIECATEGLFVQKEAFDKILKELMKYPNIDEGIPTVKKVPFFDWLTERE